MPPKKQMNIRISDYTRQQVEALQAHLSLGEEPESQTRVIAAAIDRMYKEEFETQEKTTMEFLLNIYTWPPLRGTQTETRTMFFHTATEATEFINSQNEPFACAVLLRHKQQLGYYPSDWNGNYIDPPNQWPVIQGTNGEHPAYLAFKKDYDNLVAIVREEYAQTGEPMSHIAARLIWERHPEISGWTDEIAWEAAGG